MQRFSFHARSSRAFLGILLTVAGPGWGAELSPPPEPLALLAALQEALRQNPSLEVQRLGIRPSQLAVERDHSDWDLFVSGSLGRTAETRPTDTRLDGAQVQKSDRWSGQVGLTKPLATGGDVSLSFQDRKQATNSTFATLNPSYSSGLTLRLRRPLARGLGADSTQRGLRQSRLSERRSIWEFRRSLLETLKSTEEAYWNLSAARRRTGVARQNLEAAKRLLSHARKRLELGTLAKVEVLEAEAAVSQRQSEWLNRQRAEARLELDLLGRIRTQIDPEERLPLLADTPGTYLGGIAPSKELLSQGLMLDPGYQLSILDLRANEVELRFARNAVLPQIDWVASAAANGLGAGHGRSYDNLSKLDTPTYFVGLDFQLPLGARRAKAERDRQRAQIQRQLKALQAQEAQLLLRIEDARRRLLLDRERLQPARAAVDAAGKKLAAEEERYQEGLLTADDLLRFQQELSSAKLQEVEVQIEASLSQLDLWIASGSYFEARGIELPPDALTSTDLVQKARRQVRGSED